MEKTPLNFEKIDRNHFKVLLGCVEIGFLSVLSDFIHVSILSYQFKIKVQQKRFVRELILSVYDKQSEILRTERKMLPLRINGNTKLIPNGKAKKIMS